MARRVWAEQREQRLVERDVDDLANAGDLITVTKRRQHGGRARQGRHHVGHRERRQRRRALGLTGGDGEPAHGFHHRAEAGPIAIWTVLAPTRDASDDEPPIEAEQDVGAQAPLLQRAGDEILDEDVGVADEALQQILASRVREVERHRPLAARVDLPPELAAVAQPRAQRIAATRVLDLDDVGAVIGEHRGQHATGDEPRAVDDPQALERAAHFAAFLM